MNQDVTHTLPEHRVLISADWILLEGYLVIPDEARGIVLFAHGSGSSRHSPRHHYMARLLQQAGLATLLMDLLTPEEEDIDRRTRQLAFNVDLLASRLIRATDWLTSTPVTRRLSIGYLGAHTGSAAALVAATRCPHEVKAIVSSGGRPDLAGAAIAQVQAPTLFIVGGYDLPTISMNEDALAQLHPATDKRLAIVPRATHRFEEAGALEQVARLAGQWFNRYLSPIGAIAAVV